MPSLCSVTHTYTDSDVTMKSAIIVPPRPHWRSLENHKCITTDLSRDGNDRERFWSPTWRGAPGADNDVSTPST